MNDSLYGATSRASSSAAQSSSTPDIGATLSSAISTTGNNFFSFLQYNFQPVLHAVNYFVLAWILVHSLFLLIEFYVHFFKFAAMDEFLTNQEIGRKKFFESWGMWGHYLISLCFFTLYQWFAAVYMIGFLLAVVSFISFGYTFFAKALPKTPIIDIFEGKDDSLVGRGVKQFINFRTKLSPPLKKNSSVSKEKSDPKAESSQSLVGGVISGLADVATGVAVGLASTAGASSNPAPPEKK
jgi:hypothetical protein